MLKKNNGNSPRKNQMKGCSLLKAQVRILLKCHGGVKAGSIYRETFKRLTTQGIKTSQQANLRNS